MLVTVCGQRRAMHLENLAQRMAGAHRLMNSFKGLGAGRVHV